MLYGLHKYIMDIYKYIMDVVKSDLFLYIKIYAFSKL